ncbi:MAG: Omp28 family outer membrane lipoprotein [Duncaniella sp.]|nr:Omp28 family outer membrane lipoprotein [Duncaniella sp.]
MLKKFLGLCAILTLATSCSDISENDRLIEMDTVKPVRSIVIEDFTGQTCVNCPDAHTVLEALVEQYGEDYVIPVSIHAGSFGMAAANSNYDKGNIWLMQPEGNQIQDAYGSINSWPIGVVNGRGGFANLDAWAKATRIELLRESEASVSVIPDYDPATGTIEIETIIHPYADIQGKLKVWVIESGIVARQRNTEGWITDYRHDNVWRASASALEGDAVSLENGKTFTMKHTIAVRDSEKERWNTENLSVVAILGNSSGYINAQRRAVQRVN